MNVLIIHKNYLKSDYKILINFNKETHLTALEITQKNFFMRLLIVYTLIQKGYYENRSGIFSIFIDLFFPHF